MRDDVETKLKEIKLSKKLKIETEGIIKDFFSGKNFLKVKDVAENFGLKSDFEFSVEIISAEEKYLFNYFSGAFGNKNLKEGAEKLPDFLDNEKFKKLIQHLSGRAVYRENTIKNVLQSLDYLEELGYAPGEGDFVHSMRSLCYLLQKDLKTQKLPILIGVSKEEEIGPFGSLLAHESFHHILIGNKICFHEINEKLDYLDEELANFLLFIYSGRKKGEMTIDWENILIPLNKQERFIKIKEIHKNFLVETN